MLRSLLFVALLATGLLLATHASQRADAGFVVVTVDTTADDNGTCDDGNCSLREALALANVSPTEIRFNIAGPGPHAIAPTTPLPVIAQPVIIDGTTNPDFISTPVIVLDGSLVDTGDGGLELNGANSTVRGLVICNFPHAGIQLAGGTAHIEGNYIGIDPSGTHAEPNGLGIRIASSGNTVGGVDATSRNLISGNSAEGIVVTPGANDNQIEHNFIGTSADGMSALSNLTGVQLFESNANRIDFNVISGNANAGVFVSSSSDNTVQSNGIGLNLAGEALANGVAGVVIDARNADSLGNLIGGNAANLANIIAFNDGPGVLLLAGDGHAVSGNRIFRNAIYSNAGLGIDLTASSEPPGDGVTPNDTGDVDSGPNGFQNAPHLASAATGSWAVAGTLQSAPDTEYRIELFVSATCDPSGSGEGDSYLGAFAMILPQDGQEAFSAHGDDPVQAGHFITATATNLTTNDTSEFSNCVLVAPQGATPTPTPTRTQAPTQTPGGPTATPGGLPGDGNCDGLINSIDAAIVLQLGAGLLGSIPCPQNADVNHDGHINSLDAALILQRVAGLLAHF